MSFWQITSVNLCSVTINLLFLIGMSRTLLGRIPNRGKRHAAVCVFAAVAFGFFTSALGAVFYLEGLWAVKWRINAFLWTYFVLACKVLLLLLLYRAPLRNCALSILMTELLYSYGELLSEWFVSGRVYHMSVLEERNQYLFWMFVINPACLLLCALVVEKSGVGRLYRQWLEQKEVPKGIVALLFAYPALYYLLQMAGQRPKSASLLMPFMLLLAIHMIFVYVERDRQQKQYIAFQQADLRQQSVYIERMENLQAEFRRFRHDFKNMMAGMSLQAREGDTGVVQAFIQDMTEDFDRQIGDQVYLLNQLANVRMVEVKGLLLEKLGQMQKEGIRCELEVLRPFTGTRMRSVDLLRCLGILVDNAMDEVRGRKDARIHVMISSQEGCTTFLVKNVLYGEIDFARLGTNGYTTKGEGHGVGLESYRRIVEGYDFVFPLTAVRDGYFVQELKIQG